MGNKITDQLKLGTLGELFVQLKLLEFDVQAAPPIKDSGNDLIAVRGEEFRGIQVKTTASDKFRNPRNLPLHFHILALVKVVANDSKIYWDDSKVYLIHRGHLVEGIRLPQNLEPFEINEHLINELFPIE